MTSPFARQVPERCARCDAEAVVPIVYGLPGEELIEAAARWEVALGGCIVGPQEWTCRACGYTWPLPPEALTHPVVMDALHLAYHGDGEPQIEVGHMLFEAGYEPYVVAAGLVGGASGLAAGEIADAIGAPAASLVETLTERGDIRDPERRRLELRARVARAGGSAAAVYAAQGLCLLRALQPQCAGVLRNIERDLRMLERRAPTCPFVIDLRGELPHVVASG